MISSAIICSCNFPATTIVGMSKTVDTSAAAWGSMLLAHARSTEEVNRRAAKAGMPSMDWYDVLWALERAGSQRLRLSEVADLLTTSRPNFTRLLDRLEEAGLVVRERSVEDRRTVYALITPEGKKLRKKMWGFYERAIEEVFTSHLTQEEQIAIESGLNKVYQSLRDQ